MTNPAKQKNWAEKILDFKNSGKTKETWCEKNNISLRQFSYWFKQLTRNQTAQWIPVEIKESKADGVAPILQEEIKILPVVPLNIKIGAASIEVYPDTDREFLLKILRTLQSL